MNDDVFLALCLILIGGPVQKKTFFYYARRLNLSMQTTPTCLKNVFLSYFEKILNTSSSMEAVKSHFSSDKSWTHD